MTKQEFESFSRGIAYDVIRFQRKEIDGDELCVAVKVKLGNDVFNEAEKIIDESRK